MYALYYVIRPKDTFGDPIQSISHQITARDELNLIYKSIHLLQNRCSLQRRRENRSLDPEFSTTETCELTIDTNKQN